MPHIILDSRDLLEFNSTYGVLICRECQYAIQKRALQSHFLRHKIYRGDRQRLLSSIAKLDLLEPDHVPLPAPESAPIDTLPIISGYRCTAAGCGNLCASSKRMRRHWSEFHGHSEPPHNSSCLARPVKLQTFFRGTKLRYFEVAFSKADDEEVHEVATAPPLSPPPPRLLTPPKDPPKSSVDFDLESLIYFHHFTTTTSLTLPNAEHQRPATHYWQRDIVLQALQRRWLMCGLLAISACHLAALADDTMIEKLHRERSMQFFSEFSGAWEEMTKHNLGAGVEEEARNAGGKLRCILRCAQWALAQHTLDQGLQSIMTSIRDFAILNFALGPLGIPINDDNRQEETFAQAKRILGMRSSSNSESFSSSDNSLPALLKRLRELPHRMAETFGKPESAQDIFATLSAIAALAECCEISFSSDEVGAAWWGMAMWLSKVPEHFHQMVSRQNPAAIVVLAHWVSLVERAEYCGCWFLRGSAKSIMLLIAERLPADNCAIQSLVGSLMK